MVNIVSKFLVPIYHGLRVMVILRFGGKGSLSHLINDGGVCRTAPDTPRLLIIYSPSVKIMYVFKFTVQCTIQYSVLCRL